MKREGIKGSEVLKQIVSKPVDLCSVGCGVVLRRRIFSVVT